jgi:aldehyde:ferredoxin oxidoreductase
MSVLKYGWTGKILRVDLSERKWSIEESELYTERFIGGIGLGYKVLWDEVRPEISAFNPENTLVFAPGPLTGTLTPGAGRFEIVAKSPRSFPKETVTRSGVGGFWGPELKFAGYDALIIKGISESLVNLEIYDDKVKIVDAKEYAGKDTYLTQDAVRKRFDKNARILCIGPAGENLSRLAVILSESGFVSGKSGFGAVMGSKKLKAIAVRGTKPLRVFNPDRLIELSRIVKQLSINPMSEWTSTLMFEQNDRDTFLNKYRQKNVGCFGCPTPCFAHLSVPEVGESQCHCIGYFYYPYATKYYGHTDERDKAVFESIVMSNKLGLDHYEFYGMLNFLKDSFEAGLLKSEPELPIEQIGSREFIRKFLDSVAFRKGIGAILTEGSARAANEIKGSWQYCSKYFPAYGSAEHESPRNNPGVALLWALDSRDPIIDQHTYSRITSSFQKRPKPYRLSIEDARKIAKRLYGSELAVDQSTFEQKPHAVIYTQNKSGVVNSLVVCDWVYPIVLSYFFKDFRGDTSIESKLFTAVTGVKISEQELDLIGERIWNLARAIMIREGRSRAADSLHEDYFKEVCGDPGISKEDFEGAKTEYYKMRGWNEKGQPTTGKLLDIGLTDIAESLTDYR